MKERTFEGGRKANTCTLHPAGSAGVTKTTPGRSTFHKTFLICQRPVYHLCFVYLLTANYGNFYRRLMYGFSSEPPALGHF